ncbi:MAG: sulfatase-like hydrolase/transferase [Verrucomicrobiota bacterium]
MKHLLFILLTLSACHILKAAPPNVVFILADDLGWGDLSCHGSNYIKTPNIDSLAAEGTDFHGFNTASPVCSPSRTGFMTGKFPARFGIRGAIGAVAKNIEWNMVDWLDPKAVMLPRLMQGAGYVTGHVGKWHLQSGQAADGPLPAAYGVMEAALFAGTAHPNVEKTVKDDEIWAAATDFLERNREKPFYLNVWMHETHLAHHPSEESLKAYAHLDERQRIYAAVATDADRGVGLVLAKLKELGLEENTLVVFSSDNGPENTHPTAKKMGTGYGGYYSVGETGGRKGRKRSLHEGGTNTAFIVRWPGQVPAGRVDKVTRLSATDLLPTVCAATGVNLPEGYEGDGENMLTALKGAEMKRTQPIFWEWTGGEKPPTNWARWAIHDGDWKLLTDDAGRVELYELTKDAAEARDLSTKNPEIVQQLTAKLDAWKATLPTSLPAECLSKMRQNKRALKSSKGDKDE